MPDHPYTKLLEELDGAHFVRFNTASRLIYAWHGGTRVEVYNMEGACADFFAVPEAATVETVEQAIADHIAEEAD
jgi:hypothetical protein